MEEEQLPLYYYNANVRRVIDGDTLILNVDVGFYITMQCIKFRFMNYNAPETRGREKAHGKKAKKKLQEILPPGKKVKVRVYKADAFGRYLCDIILPDGKTLQQLLVQLGYGVVWDGTGKRPGFDPELPYPYNQRERVG